MNYLAESIVSGIIADIESKVNIPIYFPAAKKARPMANQITENQAPEPENNFNDILLAYLNGTQDKAEINSAIDVAIKTSAERFGVDESLIRAVVQVESGYNPYAVSKSGAMGLMQLMPGTAQSLGVADPYNVFQNVYGGTKYLYEMLLRFGGDESLALAAYNAGAGAVEKYGGIPPYAETQAYVPLVLGKKELYE